nr:hypothetical protein [uncultured Pseudomonas sp.]
MGETAQEQFAFIASICDGFCAGLNKITGNFEFCGQDSYEVLTIVFGNDFTESQLREATEREYEQLAEAVREELELSSFNSSAAATTLQGALEQWSGY